MCSSGAHKQSPAQIAVSDNQNAQSLLGVAGDWRERRYTSILVR
jgi:hypothetical protein